MSTSLKSKSEAEAITLANSAIETYGDVIDNHTDYTITQFDSGCPTPEDVQQKIRVVRNAIGQLNQSRNHRSANKLLNELYHCKDVLEVAE